MLAAGAPALADVRATPRPNGMTTASDPVPSAEASPAKLAVAGMPTAFVATYGQGHPVIGVMGEYDALPGLSQKALPEKVPLVQGAAGHGCGPNMFGAASLGAAIEIKEQIAAGGLKGTVVFFGTPAEEDYSCKVYMARDGLFDDVDVVLAWHPSDETQADKVWIWLRDWKRTEVEQLLARVRLLASGAAEMTETDATVTVQGGSWEVLVNETGAKLLHANLLWLGSAAYTEQEQAFARQIQRATGVPEVGMFEGVKPLEGEPQEGGSTDVGDVSWIVPTLHVSVATMVDLYEQPGALAAVQAEFKAKRGDATYQSYVPPPVPKE
jgi:metal-dependent amidase/aminoacylase/carboxypeptidase family protein